MKTFIQPIDAKFDDTDQELARRNASDRITELQRVPIIGAVLLKGITLADSIVTQVPHKLGQTPSWVGVSVVRGATTTGQIVQSAITDKAVTLTAAGYGATITVDLLVVP